jgi:hypothetical protein
MNGLEGNVGNLARDESAVHACPEISVVFDRKSATEHTDYAPFLGIALHGHCLLLWKITTTRFARKHSAPKECSGDAHDMMLKELR